MTKTEFDLEERTAKFAEDGRLKKYGPSGRINVSSIQDHSTPELLQTASTSQ